MSSAPERIWELMADRATQGLSEAEARELAQLCRDHPEVDPLAYEEAAAAISLAMTHPEPMPEAVRQQLEQAARTFAGTQTTPPAVPEESPAPIAMIGRKRGVFYAGWIAAAACLTLAFIGWWNNIKPAVPFSQQRDQMMLASGVMKLNWEEFKVDDQGAEIKGVGGDVVWNEKEQKGFVRFTRLPVNTPSKEQYQLWIVDERGMGQRISGGIFDARPDPLTGEVVVPIVPQIRTRGAAAFAVTIEEPGGTWVSSLARRVVIAQKPKG